MPRRDEVAEDMGQDLLAGWLPFGGTIGKRLGRAISAEWARNRSIALATAESASGLTREQLAAWAEEEPQAFPLFLKVLIAAGTNGHDATLRAMGTVLGAAALASARGDADGFEDAELALRAMSELGPRHFRVLAAVADASVATSEDGKPNYAAFMAEQVASRAAVRQETASQCLLNLAGAGLVTSMSVYDGTAYPLSELGKAVLQAARVAHERPEGS